MAGNMKTSTPFVEFHFPGQESEKAPLLALDEWLQYGVRICINYASQIGATAILLAVLLLVTKSEKRSSPIFILNVLSLATDCTRNVLQCLYFTGTFYSAAFFFGDELKYYPAKDISISIAGVVLTFLQVVFIEISLVLQVRAVAATLRDTYRLVLVIISTLVVLLEVGFRFALMVTNSMAIAQVRPFNQMWLAAACNYSLAATICFFSLIFTSKLGIALYERRKLGLQQFGPMQVIFIMGCQTMIIPAIFSILENYGDVPEIASQAITITAIFLPMSSMWAAASVNPTSANRAASSAKFNASAQSGNSDASTIYTDKSPTSDYFGKGGPKGREAV